MKFTGHSVFSSFKGVMALLIALVLSYIVVFSAVSIFGFRNFGMSAFDIGIHVQAIWKLSTGEGLFNTVRGLPIWGDHCWFVMLLYAPLYWLSPRVETLLILQSVALAFGALPLAAIVKRRGGSGFAILVFAGAWLLSPALQNMNLENFHPEVLAAPFLLWAIERADAGKWRGYWVAITVALLCKEDVALTTFMLGFWVFFKNRQVGILTMLISVGWFLLCMKVFLPFFNEYGFFRFEGGYWFTRFWESKFDPSFYWSTFQQTRVGMYAWQLSLPLLFLFLLNPLLAAAALPAFIVNVLSGNDYLMSINYHYNFQTLPILFGAAAIGFCQLRQRIQGIPFLGPAVLMGILVTSLWANNEWSHLPLKKTHGRLSSQYAYFKDSGTDQRFNAFAALLPEDSEVPVAVSHNLLPHLANRSAIYMFPNPFKPMYWGIEGENLPSPDTVEMLLLDINAIGAENLAIFRGLIENGDFLLLKQEGPFMLAKKNTLKMRRQIADPLKMEPPEENIRLLIYLGEGEVRSLSPLWGTVADTEISTLEMRIPLTLGRLSSAEGLDLGANDNMRLFFQGQWDADGKTPIVFRIQADDGCRLYVDGSMVIDYEGVHAFGQQVTGTPMLLEAGTHVIALDYFEWGGEAGVKVEWAEVGGEFQSLQANQRLP